jgi:hypothetical protein
MKRDTAETIGMIAGVGVIFLLLCGLGFAVAMGVAWAITSIWPSVPFWPTAIGLFLLSALFKSSSSK